MSEPSAPCPKAPSALAYYDGDMQEHYTTSSHDPQVQVIDREQTAFYGGGTNNFVRDRVITVCRWCLEIWRT